MAEDEVVVLSVEVELEETDVELAPDVEELLVVSVEDEAVTVALDEYFRVTLVTFSRR